MNTKIILHEWEFFIIALKILQSFFSTGSGLRQLWTVLIVVPNYTSENNNSFVQNSNLVWFKKNQLTIRQFNANFSLKIFSQRIIPIVWHVMFISVKQLELSYNSVWNWVEYVRNRNVRNVCIVYTVT